jgi:hypothetical protein
MTNSEHRPNSGENDPDFDAIVSEIRTNNELDLIQHLQEFYEASINFDHKAEQFIKMGWEGNALAIPSMTNEMTSVSIIFLVVLQSILRDEREYAASEIAEIIVHDLAKRIDYFTKISTVLFADFSSKESMMLLFNNLISKSSDEENIARAIMTFYQTELMSQLKSLMSAKMKDA